jgi:hypothetical protein
MCGNNVFRSEIQDLKSWTTASVVSQIPVNQQDGRSPFSARRNRFKGVKNAVRVFYEFHSMRGDKMNSGYD